MPGYALEVTLVNRKLITLKSEKKSYAPLGIPKLYGVTKCVGKDEEDQEDESEESEDWGDGNR